MRHATAAPVVEALRALVLVPVLRRLQRQFSENLAGVPDPVRHRPHRERGGGVDYARERDFHRALLHPVRARRRTGRPLRQGARGAVAQIRRDPDRAHRRRRLYAPVDPAFVRRAARLRADRRAVRTPQIRHFARSPRARTTAGGQCADRGRDLHRHSHRHHCRRHRRARWRRAPVRPAGHGLCRRLLAVGLAHPAERRSRAASQDHQEHRPLDRRHAPPSARRHAIMVGRAGDELVLAHRHCRAVVAAAADQVTARRQ